MRTPKRVLLIDYVFHLLSLHFGINLWPLKHLEKLCIINSIDWHSHMNSEGDEGRNPLFFLIPALSELLLSTVIDNGMALANNNFSIISL